MTNKFQVPLCEVKIVDSDHLFRTEEETKHLPPLKRLQDVFKKERYLLIDAAKKIREAKNLKNVKKRHRVITSDDSEIIYHESYDLHKTVDLSLEEFLDYTVGKSNSKNENKLIELSAEIDFFTTTYLKIVTDNRELDMHAFEVNFEGIVPKFEELEKNPMV